MRRSQLKALDKKYRRLTFRLNDGDDGNFLSGWQSTNPLSDQIAKAVRYRSRKLDASRYSYFGTQRDLATQWKLFHKTVDGIEPTDVQCGAGATNLMYCFIQYLKDINVDTIYYIPPLYLTLHNALSRNNIRAIAVSKQHAFENDFLMQLPKRKRSVLFLTDPIWYCGISVPDDVINAIQQWQESTGSLIFIDGSMQYMNWNISARERTASLNPEITVRLICPAKQLCMNGYRFAYLLVPSRMKQPLSWLQSNIVGSASVDSLAFGIEAFHLSSSGAPQFLMELASRRYKELRLKSFISPIAEPNCTYYTFSRLPTDIMNAELLLNGSYYGRDVYNDYFKLNLLSPSIDRVFYQETDQI